MLNTLSNQGRLPSRQNDDMKIANYGGPLQLGNGTGRKTKFQDGKLHKARAIQVSPTLALVRAASFTPSPFRHGLIFFNGILISVGIHNG
jgi:hypothetical protein